MAQFPTAAIGISEGIQAALKDHDRKLGWLAKRINMADSTLRGQIEKRPDNITYLTMDAIAIAFEVPVEALTSREAYESFKASLAVAA
jgi:hypothetical protein